MNSGQSGTILEQIITDSKLKVDAIVGRRDQEVDFLRRRIDEIEQSSTNQLAEVVSEGSKKWQHAVEEHLSEAGMNLWLSSAQSVQIPYSQTSDNGGKCCFWLPVPAESYDPTLCQPEHRKGGIGLSFALYESLYRLGYRGMKLERHVTFTKSKFDRILVPGSVDIAQLDAELQNIMRLNKNIASLNISCGGLINGIFSLTSELPSTFESIQNKSLEDISRVHEEGAEEIAGSVQTKVVVDDEPPGLWSLARAAAYLAKLGDDLVIGKLSREELAEFQYLETALKCIQIDKLDMQIKPVNKDEPLRFFRPDTLAEYRARCTICGPQGYVECYDSRVFVGRVAAAEFMIQDYPDLRTPRTGRLNKIGDSILQELEGLEESQLTNGVEIFTQSDIQREYRAFKGK